MAEKEVRLLTKIPSAHPIHHGTSTMVKQAARNAIKKKGAVQKKKTVTKAKQKKEQDHHHASSSSSSPSIRSKFVGVSWYKRDKKWIVQIMIDGKLKHLGSFDDEKEAACKYDEQAALLNKPVNFPQHEGQEQAAKMRKKRPKARDVVGDEDDQSAIILRELSALAAAQEF